MEVPVANAGRQTDRPLVPSAVPGTEPRRGSHRNRGRGRNVTLLERVQQSPQPKGEQKRPQSVHQHSIDVRARSPPTMLPSY